MMILISINTFLLIHNPNITEHDYVIPRIRNIETAAKEWNKNYPKYSSYRLKLDEVRYIVKNSPVYRYKFGNRWLVNYDQLETLLDAYVRKRLE